MSFLVDPYRFGGGGGASYGWSPADVAGLIFWWRADQTPALGTAADSITQIDDQSGNANHGTWSGEKANLVNNVTGSLPAIHFPADNNGEIYTFPSGMMTGKTSAHIFGALKCAAENTIGDGFSGLWDFSTQGSTATHYSFTDGNVYDGFGSATRFSTGNPSPSLAAWHCLAVKAEASGYAMRLNGAAHFSNATSCGSDWIAVPQFGKSKQPGGNHYRFQGDLLDLFCYDHVLTGGDLTAAELYCSDRIDGTWVAAGGD
jgi:hypothetical protein